MGKGYPNFNTPKGGLEWRGSEHKSRSEPVGLAKV